MIGHSEPLADHADDLHQYEAAPNAEADAIPDYIEDSRLLVDAIVNLMEAGAFNPAESESMTKRVAAYMRLAYRDGLLAGMLEGSQIAVGLFRKAADELQSEESAHG